MDYTGTSIDQQHNQHNQQHTQTTFPSQQPYLPQPQPARFNSSSPQHSESRGDSTQLISPTSDILNEMASAINEGYPQPLPLPMKDTHMGTSNLHGFNDTNYNGYGKPPTSSSSTSSSGVGFQNGFGLNGINYQVDGSGLMNGNQYSANTDLNFQNRRSIRSSH